MTEEIIDKGKPLAVVSYLTIIGIIVAYFMNKDKDNNPFTNFHLRQSLGIWLTFHALGIVVSTLDYSIVRLVFYFCIGVILIFGFINAVIGKAQEVPLVGKFYQKIFASLGN
ncbi:MAG: hypothetical protein HKO72_09190 [Flavobacteriaceae bacterium]|nr:hypothetical protein [Bacteroidia bacterium]NNL61493.1 hypothetical protein [Flavobacteriaceae bacterium]